jgi:diaminohydroxyphosphoribosylaminopyrimidine deaminase/5-amino-6-(5-phosphoribosylamino)uracil reductase
VVNVYGADLRTRDAEFMRQALLLAERGRATTSPNPMVGCVIVSADGTIVGRGYHRRAGGRHAEVVALREAGERAANATLYVTLEPCCHTGRTGPCVVPITQAGVTRVVAAMADPNPQVAGNGLAYLREKGIAVDVGTCEGEARALNEAFVTAMTSKRPFVLLKIAASADARIAAALGERTPLTSAAANLFVQGTRAWVDAIMAGADTVRVDDPLLTARAVCRARPLTRVVVDWRLRVPLEARVLAGGDDPVLVMAGDAAAASQAGHVARLRDRGVEVVVGRPHDLAAVMSALHARDIRSVLVEGGAVLHRACIAAGFADRLHLFVTPRVLGPRGVAWDVPMAWSGPPSRVVPLGPDVLIDTYVHRTH